uniref:SRR1 domain containing n=1 Tax=Leptobrachium leishanense TaxID=445787 RepID=A0A8C5LQE6_9ANUR
MEGTDWQVVKKKKAAKKMVRSNETCVLKVEMCPVLQLSDSVQEQHNLIQRIYSTMENVKQSEFWCSCQECFSACLHKLALPPDGDDSGIHEMESSNNAEGKQKGLLRPDCVCYGLGNFSSCVISRHQLAFLLLFLDQLKIPTDQTCVFDPVFTALEKSVLQNLGLTVIFENEEGKRTVCKPTVFYMPHCGKALYNNLLWSNWTQEALSNIVLIGNSFKGIEERLFSRILLKHYTYINKCLPVVEEASLPESHQYNDVFNDTSIHIFPVHKLRTLPTEVWQLPEAPQYQDCEDLEIIENSKANNNSLDIRNI